MNYAEHGGVATANRTCAQNLSAGNTIQLRITELKFALRKKSLNFPALNRVTCALGTES